MNTTSNAPSDAPTDREWLEWRNSTTIPAEKWANYASN